jgi:hypothetical protein
MLNLIAMEAKERDQTQHEIKDEGLTETQGCHLQER